MTDRLTNAGLATVEENDTSRCDAVQSKVWMRGPGQELWEVYVVKADADTFGESALPGDTVSGQGAPRSR